MKVADDPVVDFYWCHIRSDDNAKLCHRATVCSMLANASILEDKTELALLCQRMRSGVPMLRSLVIRDAAHFFGWARTTFAKQKCALGPLFIPPSPNKRRT